MQLECVAYCFSKFLNINNIVLSYVLNKSSSVTVEVRRYT